MADARTQGGGTMFCRRKQWEGKNFPRELFHQTKSKRGRVLMHSKVSTVVSFQLSQMMC